MEVLHQQCPPRTVLRLYDTTLMGVGTSGGIFVDGSKTELRAVLANAILRATRHLSQRGCMIPVGLVGSDDARLVGSPDALRARTERASVRTVVGRDEVVRPIDLIHVVALANAVALRDNDAVGSLDRSAHVGLQLRTMYLTIFMDSVDLSVVVEEHAEVVDVALHVMVRPGASDIL